LREALAAYRRIVQSGGWPAVADGPKLQLGDEGERVAALRQRLELEDTLEAASPAEVSEIFDEPLERAVRRFQMRYGLDTDGVVGRDTLRALNIPAAARAQQIELNLERWRWLPQDLGRRHILINIASFLLEVIEEGRPALTMRVVVGRTYRRTPVFSDKMTYLVFNPYWHVPPSIAAQDVLSSIRKDPDYLQKQNMKVLQGWGSDAREIDPETIDWSSMNPSRLKLAVSPGAGPD
jgi:murein L,D-transpeptidase YcbB/YkuD